MKRFVVIVIGIVAAIAACGEKPQSGADAPPTPSGDRRPPAGTASATPAATPMRFVVLGDTGNANEAQRLVAEQVARTCEARGCDFLVLLGDNIYPSGACTVDYPQWETKVRAPFLSMGIPVRPVLGNHDYGGSLPEPDCAMAQVEYSTVQPLWQMPARHYVVDQGAAHMMFLDTAPVGWGGAAAYAEEQRGFFRGHLATTGKAWRLAFGHSPLLSNGVAHGNAAPTMDAFLRGVLCDGVDVYFSGHDHHREVLAATPECPLTLVVSGAASQLGAVGDSVPTLFASSTYGFTYVTVTPASLTIEMIDVAGVVDHAITLER